MSCLFIPIFEDLGPLISRYFTIIPVGLGMHKRKPGYPFDFVSFNSVLSELVILGKTKSIRHWLHICLI